MRSNFTTILQQQSGNYLTHLFSTSLLSASYGNICISYLEIQNSYCRKNFSVGFIDTRGLNGSEDAKEPHKTVESSHVMQHCKESTLLQQNGDDETHEFA